MVIGNVACMLKLSVALQQWAPTRFVLGPWPWMLLLYRYDEPSDRVFVVAMHDARSAIAATANRP
jgi:hypothetical protein